MASKNTKTTQAIARHVDAYLATKPAVTPRERDVLVLMASGTTTAEGMALALDRSVNTVQNHLKALLRATGHTSKTALISELFRSATGIAATGAWRLKAA